MYESLMPDIVNGHAPLKTKVVKTNVVTLYERAAQKIGICQKYDQKEIRQIA